MHVQRDSQQLATTTATKISQKQQPKERGVPIARQNGCISTHLMLAQKKTTTPENNIHKAQANM